MCHSCPFYCGWGGRVKTDSVLPKNGKVHFAPMWSLCFWGVGGEGKTDTILR